MNNNFRYRFTLFTPCYNSALFIERIKSSVENQTFKDFEWIVVNDNSSDNTLALLEEYISTVNFPVKLINNTTNLMLAANYNLAVEQAEGEYFVTLDHDDEYSPKYLEIMDSLIKKFDAENVAGVVARCITQFGKITPTPSYSKPIMSWFEYAKDKKGHYTGEVPRAFKLNILRKYMPFDLKLVHNPLIEAMMSFDGYNFITTNEIIRKYYVYEEAQKSISNARSSRMNYYNWSCAYNEIIKYTRKYHTSLSVKIHWITLYSCASIRLGLSLKEALSKIDRWRISVFLMYPIARLRVYFSDISYLHNLWSSFRKWRENRKFLK